MCYRLGWLGAQGRDAIDANQTFCALPASARLESLFTLYSSLNFDPADCLAALQVRLYRLPELDDDSLCSTEAGSCQCDREHTASPSSSGSALPLQLSPAAVYSTPGKVGCLSWDPNCEGVVTIGDYDGTLYQVWLGSFVEEAPLAGQRGAATCLDWQLLQQKQNCAQPS